MNRTWKAAGVLCAAAAMALSGANVLRMSAAAENNPTAVRNSAAADLPDWISNPATLPPGQQGRNSCTIAFPRPGIEWNAHKEGGCWQRPGPDNLVRQQLHRVHLLDQPTCDSDTADVFAIRVCHTDGRAGVETPCGKTGPRGCAVCPEPRFVCH